MFAPVIVFAYNRPQHLDKTLEALSKNEGAKESDVFLYIDGPKNEKGILNQEAVLRCAKTYEVGFFHSFKITVSERNKGLSASIIQGVQEVIHSFGRVIVVEDDAISAPSFLKFMNGALDYYKKDPTVWSIGGYTVPMDLPEDYKADVIKTQRVSSYAWAVWEDRWSRIDWDMPEYSKFRFSFAKRRAFNRWGKDRSSMLDDQINGRVQSWAIRFDYYMFRNNMFNIVPRHSLIKSIGNDGSGTNNSCKKDERDPFGISLDQAPLDIQPEAVSVNEAIRKNFCKPFRVSLLYLIKRYFSNQFQYRKRRNKEK